MGHSNTLHISLDVHKLDVHKESIAVAYAPEREGR